MRFMYASIWNQITGERLKMLECLIKLRKNRMNGTKHLSSDSAGTHKISRIAARYPSYPRRQVYDLIVETEKETTFDIYVRIPAWTAGEGTVYVYNTENADELRAVMEGENPNGEKSAQSRVRL